MKIKRLSAVLLTLCVMSGSVLAAMAVPAAAQTPTATPATFAPCPAGAVLTVSPPSAAAPTTVTVAVTPTSLNIKPASAGDFTSFHLHYFIDTPATPAGSVIPTDDPKIIHSGTTTQDLGALTPGQHTVSVVLGQLSHVACDARGSVTFAFAQAATPTATPSGANPTAIATALQGALDRGDVAAAMSLVTEDISVGGIGLCAASPCVGKDAVRPEFQRRVDANIQRVRLNVQVVGNTVTSIFEVRDNNTRRCNVERILLSEANDVRGSLVAAQRVQLDLTDAQTVALRTCQQAAAAGAAKAAPPKSGSGGYLDGGSSLGLWALGALAVVAAGVAFGAGVATRRRDQ